MDRKSIYNIYCWNFTKPSTLRLQTNKLRLLPAFQPRFQPITKLQVSMFSSTF